jgi:enoyl-CoA hydratase/carnithine racemase
VEKDSRVRVILLEARGKVFSSGYDVNDLTNIHSGPLGKSFVNPFGLLADQWADVSKLTVAKVQGGVYGGAIDLLLGCDFRLGSKEACMAMPALRFGFQYYASGLKRYVANLGLRNSRDIFFSGRTFTSKEMLDLNVLNSVYDTPNELDQAAAALAEDLASLAPISAQATKIAFAQLAAGTLDQVMHSAAETAALDSMDLREGLLARRELRKPVFNGR